MLVAARTGAWSGKPLPYDAEVEYLESTGTQWVDTGLVWDAGEWECRAVITALSSVVENYIISQYASGQGVVYAFAYMHNMEVRLAYKSNNVAHLGVSSAFFGKTYEWCANYANGQQTLSIGDLATLRASTMWVSGATQEGMRIIVGGMRNYGGQATGIRFGRIRIEHEMVLARYLIPVRIGAVGYFYDRVSGQLFGNDGTGAFIIGPDKTT